jgi:hypothetical protein
MGTSQNSEASVGPSVQRTIRWGPDHSLFEHSATIKGPKLM